MFKQLVLSILLAIAAWMVMFFFLRTMGVRANYAVFFVTVAAVVGWVYFALIRPRRQKTE